MRKEVNNWQKEIALFNKETMLLRKKIVRIIKPAKLQILLLLVWKSKFQSDLNFKKKNSNDQNIHWLRKELT